MVDTTLKNNVRKLVSEEELERALELLSENEQNDSLLNDLTLQKSKLQFIRKREQNGSLTSSEINRELNITRKFILEFIIKDPINKKKKEKSLDLEGFEKNVFNLCSSN